MYEKCKNGLHPLIELARISDGFSDKVVRWCPDCGAVVIDIDCDGRVYAGRIMKMKLPKLAKDIIGRTNIM